MQRFLFNPKLTTAKHNKQAGKKMQSSTEPIILRTYNKTAINLGKRVLCWNFMLQQIEPPFGHSAEIDPFVGGRVNIPLKESKERSSARPSLQRGDEISGFDKALPLPRRGEGPSLPRSQEKVKQRGLRIRRKGGLATTHGCTWCARENNPDFLSGHGREWSCHRKKKKS